MKALSISEVRSRLPEIVDDVLESNEAVIITRYGRPVASVQPLRPDQAVESLYPLRGTPITVADDFDEPMPEMWSALAAAEERSTCATPGPVRARRQKGRS